MVSAWCVVLGAWCVVAGAWCVVAGSGEVEIGGLGRKSRLGGWALLDFEVVLCLMEDVDYPNLI